MYFCNTPKTLSDTTVLCLKYWIFPEEGGGGGGTPVNSVSQVRLCEVRPLGKIPEYVPELVSL